jgi:hypothetical protein
MLRHVVDEVEGSPGKGTSLDSLSIELEVPLGLSPFWLEKECLGMLPMTKATNKRVVPKALCQRTRVWLTGFTKLTKIDITN